MTDNGFRISYYNKILHTHSLSYLKPLPQSIISCPVVGSNAMAPRKISSRCPSRIHDDTPAPATPLKTFCHTKRKNKLSSQSWIVWFKIAEICNLVIVALEVRVFAYI
jgi:hypothetical protein